MKATNELSGTSQQGRSNAGWQSSLLVVLFALLTLVTLEQQTRSLALFPIANATRWYSDESWVMEEAASHIAHGVVTYPHARASTLAYSKGVLLGTPWLSSLLYGLPVVLAPRGADIVLIGRIVSLSLSILTILALFLFLRRVGVSDILAAFAMLLLVTTRADFISSHCARPDVLAGLIVLLVVGYFSYLRTIDFTPRSARWWFLFGAIVMGLAWTSSVHLLTLLGPLAIWIMFAFGAFKRFRFTGAAIGGALLAASALAAIYFVTASGMTFLGSSTRGLQFDAIIQQTPILRPFSRSVQMANILIRLKLFWIEAPGVLLLAMADFLLFVFVKIRRRAHLFSATERFVFSSTAVVLCSWLLLQLASPTYTSHVLALLIFSLTLLMNALVQQVQSRSVFVLTTTVAALALVAIGYRDSLTAYASAERLSNNNREAMTSILHSLRSDWHDTVHKPLVLVETPALHEIQRDTSVEVMTDHFAGFRTSSGKLLDVMLAQKVNYVILYNSDHYPKNRYTDDEFFMSVVASSKLLAREARPLFDMGNAYFDTSVHAMDTLSLYRLQ